MYLAMPLLDTIAEIGSYRGASTTLAASRARLVYAVDPWEGCGDNDGALGVFLARNLSNVRILRMRSLEALSHVPNRSLDFVYIDAMHGYEDVKADIEGWLPKIKPGMWIGGHDYHAQGAGVVRAVNECLGQPAIFRDSSWLFKL